MENGLFEALTQSLREAGQIHRGQRNPFRRVKPSPRKQRPEG
jgi:hypothetical protein